MMHNEDGTNQIAINGRFVVICKVKARLYNSELESSF